MGFEDLEYHSRVAHVEEYGNDEGAGGLGDCGRAGGEWDY